MKNSKYGKDVGCGDIERYMITVGILMVNGLRNTLWNLKQYQDVVWTETKLGLLSYGFEITIKNPDKYFTDQFEEWMNGIER